MSKIRREQPSEARIGQGGCSPECQVAGPAFALITDGNRTFEIDDEVEARMEQFRQPGDDDSTWLRRILKTCGDIDLPPKKAN